MLKVQQKNSKKKNLPKIKNHEKYMLLETKLHSPIQNHEKFLKDIANG
jgi:hypothetical protein